MATSDAGEEKPRRPRPLPLRDARDAKRLLCRVVNEVRAGDLEPKRASAICYAVNTFLSAHAAAETDDRLDALEARLGVGS